jgi:hypothetical protein
LRRRRQLKHTKYHTRLAFPLRSTLSHSHKKPTHNAPLALHTLVAASNREFIKGQICATPISLIPFAHHRPSPRQTLHCGLVFGLFQRGLDWKSRSEIHCGVKMGERKNFCPFNGRVVIWGEKTGVETRYCLMADFSKTFHTEKQFLLLKISENTRPE